MFLFDWYKEFLEIRRDNESAKINLAREQVCESCEYLKLQNEKQSLMVSDLINKLTKQSEPEVVIQQTREAPRPIHMPWNVRRQILEGESKVAAQKMRENQELMSKAKVNISPSGGIIFNPDVAKVAPADDPDVLALEKEMDLVAKEREAQR